MTTPSPALIPELTCSDIKISLPFYTDVLGFNIIYDRPENGFAMIERQGAQLMLDQIASGDAGRSWITGTLERPFGRGVNLQIDTTDANALYKTVQKSDATIFMEIEDKWYRAEDIFIGNRQFIVQDPDGYLLRFAEDLGDRDEDPTAKNN